MKLLFDTRVLLWAAADLARLSPAARSLLEDPETVAIFSAISLWEVAIKAQLDRDDFAVHPHRFRATLLDRGYIELPVTAEHGLALRDLPTLHRDPLDRLLLAQARHEGAILVTADTTLARYPVPVRLV